MGEKLGRATYSPEDNKLRFYPDARLSKEDYIRARASGFIWAPKQELFVAPMWTPSREDLLIEWCGSIDDEDTSLVERSEHRAERFEDYSASRAKDSESAHAAVESICEHIPLGQPILIGHHSERHARKDAERIENGMRKTIKMWEQSKYWQDRAKGAIRAAKYKELPAVRARRIKKIEAENRKMERSRAECAKHGKFWSGQMTVKNTETGESRPLEICQSNYYLIVQYLGCDSYHLSFCWPLDRYPRIAPASQYEGDMGMWSALGGSDGQNHAVCTLEQARDRILPCLIRFVARYDRWIAHYENRLAYERAMLAEDGGIASDQVKPEKGGACKCWASHWGGWSYITKVNQVSVTVLDNWGNERDHGGDRNFTRTIPFDKLSSVWSAAQVSQARAEGRLVEYSDKTGFCILERGKEEEAVKLATETGTQRNIRLHVEAVRNSGTACDCKDCHAAGIGKSQEAKIDALRSTLKAGVQVVSAPQLFPTPPEIAKRMVELAELQICHRILEPSAGTGNILREIDYESNRGGVVAVEINSQLCRPLQTMADNVYNQDFLITNGNLGKFDRIVMNPPFKNGSDIKHIEHALTMLADGGKLVAICANGPRQRNILEPLAEAWIDLPAGSFSDQGTEVNAAIVVITK